MRDDLKSRTYWWSSTVPVSDVTTASVKWTSPDHRDHTTLTLSHQTSPIDSLWLAHTSPPCRQRLAFTNTACVPQLLANWQEERRSGLTLWRCCRMGRHTAILSQTGLSCHL